MELSSELIEIETGKRSVLAGWWATCALLPALLAKVFSNALHFKK
jgi:hypothetical protein